MFLYNAIFKKNMQEYKTFDNEAYLNRNEKVCKDTEQVLLIIYIFSIEITLFFS
jgi:hypothetical protein